MDPTPLFESLAFKDKVVIITGGSTGIGAATATFYAKAGARIAIVARRADRLAERKAIIEKEVPGTQILTVAGDISNPEVGKHVVEAAVDKWNRLDILVSNSAVMSGGAPSMLSKRRLRVACADYSMQGSRTRTCRLGGTPRKSTCVAP